MKRHTALQAGSRCRPSFALPLDCSLQQRLLPRQPLSLPLLPLLSLPTTTRGRRAESSAS